MRFRGNHSRTRAETNKEEVTHYNGRSKRGRGHSRKHGTEFRVVQIKRPEFKTKKKKREVTKDYTLHNHTFPV